MTPYYADDTVTIWHGDALDVLATLPDCSVDAVVTDPPYDLTANKKGGTGAASINLDSPYGRSRIGTGNGSGGFMGKAWDSTGVAFDPETWRRVIRILKPGGHLLAFGGTRTSHRLACAIEDAGFEIRDSIAWLYGQGFPKSLRVSRDERFCHCDATVHTSSRTSPEPETDDHTRTADASDEAVGEGRSARRATSGPQGSLAGYRPVPGSGDVLPHPAAASAPASLQLQECAPTRNRSVVLADDRDGGSSRSLSPAPHSGHPSNLGSVRPSRSPNGEPPRTLASTSPADTSESASHTPGTTLDPSSFYGTGLPLCSTCGKPKADGLGTALKPSFEPVICARKPLVGTVAANILAYGTGGLNVDGCRIGTAETLRPNGPIGYHGGGSGGQGGSSAGRWPANVALDEHQAAALDEMSGEVGANSVGSDPAEYDHRNNVYGEFSKVRPFNHEGGKGGASRFFYTSKASSDERVSVNGVSHPTVKSLSLMRWLVRLVTPPGGIILEPFAGSGTTVEAAILEGFRCIAIEREADYLPLITQRIHRRRDPIAYLTTAGEDLGLFDLGDGAA